MEALRTHVSRPRRSTRHAPAAHLVTAAFLAITLAAAAGYARAQTISWVNAPAEVGAGLQSGIARARLSTTQHGGVLISVASSDPALCLVSPNGSTVGSPSIGVFVPNGSTDALFVLQGLEAVAGSPTISASAPGITGAMFTVAVVTPAVALTGLLSSITVPDPIDTFWVTVGTPNAAGTAIGTAQAVRIGGFALTATITSANGTVGQLVTSSAAGTSAVVSVLPGASTSPNTVAGGGVAFDGLSAGTATVQATIVGFVVIDAATQIQTVTAAALSFLGVPADVGAGLRSAALRARLNGSAHGGTTVHVESADPSRLVLSGGASTPGQAAIDVLVPDGSTDALFYAHGLEATTGVVGVTASAPGFAPTSNGITVVTASYDISALASTIDTLDPDDTFVVRVGLPVGGSSGVLNFQVVRPGATPLQVRIVSQNAAIGLLETNSSSDDTATVPIQPLENSTAATVAAGGVAFDGVGAGTTLVQAQIPGLLPTLDSIRSVTVTQPTISPLGFTARVGAGLQSSSLRARLGASAHGGVTVHIEVADPSLAVISSGSSTVGAAVLDIPVPNGTTDALFFLQALEGQVGQARLQVSAPGFATLLDSIPVVQPAVDISGLLTSVDTAGAPDAFTVRVGAPNAALTVLALQGVRPGSPGVIVDILVADGDVGRLQTLTTSGPAASLLLSSGQSTSPTSVAGGGVAFDGLSVGTTTVAASAVGFLQIPNATVAVAVNPATISFLGTAAKLGAGLQTAALRARLSGSGHGGTVVHLESQDPASLLLSSAVDLVGGSSLDIPVADGFTDAIFYAQAIDGQVGLHSIEALAPGFTTNQTAIEVVQPAVSLRLLQSSLAVGGPDDPFVARVGVANLGNSSVDVALLRRAGAPPLQVTVTTSVAAVSEVVTLAGSSPSQIALIPAGVGESASSVAGGGVAHRAVGTGSTLVSASIPGFFQVGDATQAVTVSSSGIALLGVPAQLGDGLQVGPLTARLSNALHGGVTVNIASADPAKLLVSSGPLVAGSPSVAVPLLNGETDAHYYLQGVGGAAGVAQVTASAAGFNSGNVGVEIVDAALQLAALPDSVDVLASDAAFLVQVGVPDASTLGLAQLQPVSPATAGQSVSLISSDGAVGRLITSTVAAPAVTVLIPAGSAQTAATVAGGGVAFDPLTPGSTTVQGAAVGFAATTAASRLVVVTGTLTAVERLVARATALEQNHPNPFNPQTSIRFALPEQSHVALKLYDLTGRLVVTLVEGTLDGGTYDLVWSGIDGSGQRVASGVYLYELQTEQARLTRKLTIVK